MNRFVRLSALLKVAVALGVLAGCDFNYPKATEGDSTRLNEQNDCALGYAEIRAQVLIPKCLGCHTQRAPILTTYDQVKGEIEAIRKTTLITRSMPKKTTLTAAQRSALEAWINQGAPEFAADAATTPDPAPSRSPIPTASPTSSMPPSLGPGIPRPVTFTVLKERVLDVSCNACHAPKNEDGLTDLTTWEGMKSVENLVLPLVFGIAKGEKGEDILVPPAQRMPPEKTTMTEEERAILLLWYSDGKLSGNEK